MFIFSLKYRYRFPATFLNLLKVMLVQGCHHVLLILCDGNDNESHYYLESYSYPLDGCNNCKWRLLFYLPF